MGVRRLFIVVNAVLCLLWAVAGVYLYVRGDAYIRSIIGLAAIGSVPAGMSMALSQLPLYLRSKVDYLPIGFMVPVGLTIVAAGLLVWGYDNTTLVAFLVPSTAGSILGNALIRLGMDIYWTKRSTQNTQKQIG